MQILTENRNRCRSTFSGTGGPCSSIVAEILSAPIWLYILSSNRLAASTLFSFTHDCGWKLNGSTFFSPWIASCRAFSSHADDFCGCRNSEGRGNISAMNSSSTLLQYCSTAFETVCGERGEHKPLKKQGKGQQWSP